MIHRSTAPCVAIGAFVAEEAVSLAFDDPLGRYRWS